MNNFEDIDKQSHRISTLFQAIIWRRLADLEIISKHKRCKNAPEEAKKWLNTKNSDFLMVCNLAQYDPIEIEKIAKKVILFKQNGNNKRFIPTSFGVKFHKSK